MGKKIEIEITGDTKSLERALSRSQKAGNDFQRGMEKASKGALVALGAIGVGVGLSVRAASNLEEQINKTAVVFRGSEKAIHKWSETTASSFGISRRAALEAAGTFGNMLVPMGIARDRAGQMSTKFVELAADMASFNNASPEDTLDALRAGLAGETEPLRRFGVFLNEARIKQEALNLGLVKGNEKLTAAEKAQATYSIILKDTADAQGDFTRTSDSLANQQRILQAQFEDTAAALGNALLPVATDAAGVLLDIVEAAKENKTEFQVLVGAAAALAGGIVLLNTSLSIYNSSLLAATKATKGLRFAMAVTPWGAAILGATLLAEHLLNQKQDTDAAKRSMDDLTRSIGDYNSAISQGQKARENYEASSRRVESAEIALNRAVKERARVMKDDNATLDDRREATLNVAEAQANLRDATRDATAAGTRLREEQGKQVQASLSAKNALDTMHKSFKDWSNNKKIDTQMERRKAGIDEVTYAMHTGRQNVERYAAAISAGADKIRASNPKLARTAEVAADLARAWGRVVSLPAAREFVARFRIITTVEENRLNNPLHRATGGPVIPGQAYIVGETRPELFVPSSPGRILSHVPNTGGSSGGTVKVIVVGGDRAGQDWIQSLDRDYRRANGRPLLAG